MAGRRTIRRADAGLMRVGVVAVDGTKVHANASERATRDYEQIAREILEQAAEIDAAQDERFGERRGGELPPALSTREGRQRWLRDAQRRLDQRRADEADRALAGQAARRGAPAAGVGTRRGAARERRIRGLSGARGDEGWSPFRRSAQALSAARNASGEDQPDRSRFAQRQDAARLGAGL